MVCQGGTVFKNAFALGDVLRCHQCSLEHRSLFLAIQVQMLLFASYFSLFSRLFSTTFVLLSSHNPLWACDCCSKTLNHADEMLLGPDEVTALSSAAAN